jgi:hypothetical protein
MNNKIRAAFLVLIILQALHSVEEFIFKFHEVFPPMVSIYRNAPAIAQPAFVLANSLLVLVGFVCLFRWVWPARRGAKAVAWVWAGAEALNVIAHCVWAISIRGYNPGLVTGLGFVPVVAYLIYLLKRATAHAGA